MEWAEQGYNFMQSKLSDASLYFHPESHEEKKEEGISCFSSAKIDGKILLVQGTAFNWPNSDHFRIVFLPREDDIVEAIGRLSKFLLDYRIKHGTN